MPKFTIKSSKKKSYKVDKSEKLNSNQESFQHFILADNLNIMDSEFQKKYINYFYFVKKEQKILLKYKEGRLLVKFNLAFYESGNFAALKKSHV